MEKKKFTFRQRWFPTFEDADNLDRAKAKMKGNDFPYHGTLGMVQFLSRWMRSLILAGVLTYGGCQVVGNNIEYSEGQRVGVINKLSEIGLIWKTKEGQLSLEGRTSTGSYTGAGVWNFSIDKTASRGEDTEKLYSDLIKLMEEGKRVKIIYKQDLVVYPWRAETTYLVQKVESLENK